VRLKFIFFISSKLSRWQAAMAQFLLVAAKDKTVSIAGTVQSRFYETGCKNCDKLIAYTRLL
jgi:hypothetical protein